MRPVRGAWAQLRAGMDDTFRFHGRRLRAELDSVQIFEMSPALLAVAGFDGYLRRFNPAFEVFGYTREELLGRTRSPRGRGRCRERRSPRSLDDRQHHFAPQAVLLAARERLSRRGQWEDLHERGTQIAAIDPPRQRAELVAIGLDDEVHASLGRLFRHRDQPPTGAQRGAGATQ
jgi:PAS domain-containing protein